MALLSVAFRTPMTSLLAGVTILVAFIAVLTVLRAEIPLAGAAFGVARVILAAQAFRAAVPFGAAAIPFLIPVSLGLITRSTGATRLALARDLSFRKRGIFPGRPRMRFAAPFAAPGPTVALAVAAIAAVSFIVWIHEISPLGLVWFCDFRNRLVWFVWGQQPLCPFWFARHGACVMRHAWGRRAGGGGLEEGL